MEAYKACLPYQASAFLALDLAATSRRMPLTLGDVYCPCESPFNLISLSSVGKVWRLDACRAWATLRLHQSGGYLDARDPGPL